MLLTQLIDEKSVSYWSSMIQKLIDYIPTLLFSLIIFTLGLILLKIILKIVEKALEKSKLDKTVHSFLKSMLKYILLTLISVIALSSLGVEMSTIVAVVGAAGVAIGLAIKDSLSNVAGGFIILFSKPFKKGDYIEATGVSGTVEEITIISTKLLTPDNKVIRIPNGVLSGSTITNFTEEQLRRLDLKFTISYQDDFQKAKEILTNIIEKHPLALREPEPFVRLSEQASNCIIITTRVWVSSENYWDLNYDMLEQVKTEFDKNGITIPFNQLDVHINNS